MTALTREDVIAAVQNEGSQAAAARRLGVSRQRVNYIVKHGGGGGGGRPGRPKGSRNKSYVRDRVAARPGRANGPMRLNRTNLQVPGVYSLAQQQLRRAFDAGGVNRSKLARDLGYRTRGVIRWLYDGSIPHPTLRTAVEFEKRFGVRCVDWFEPPIKER